MKCSRISLGIIDAQGERDRCGDGIWTSIHGARAINDDQRILAVCEIFLSVPGDIDRFPFFCSNVPFEERSDDLVRSQSACMNLLSSFCNSVHKSRVAVAVITKECFPVLEHCFGRRLGVVEGIVFLAEVIFNDADLCS